MFLHFVCMFAWFFFLHFFEYSYYDDNTIIFPYIILFSVKNNKPSWVDLNCKLCILQITHFQVIDISIDIDRMRVCFFIKGYSPYWPIIFYRLHLCIRVWKLIFPTLTMEIRRECKHNWCIEYLHINACLQYDSFLTKAPSTYRYLYKNYS